MDIETIKWLATIMLTMGAVFVSLSVKLSTVWWPYVCFLIGHIIWTIAAFKLQEMALLVLNVVFIVIDCYAILLRLNIIRRKI